MENKRFIKKFIFFKKMKIGYLIQSYSLGGVDTFLINLLNESNRKDIIKIFYNSSHPNISYLKNNLNRKVKFIKYDVFSVEENYKFKKISYKILFLSSLRFYFFH